ncbi:putative glutathione transferase [Helianthus debilis subsp. tardiflorus]
MANEVKLHGTTRSLFVCRAVIALKLKEIKYEFVAEDLSNKSADLIKYNPVYKKVPVLLHNGNPNPWHYSLVDAYEKAQARFWAKFMDDKCLPAVFKAVSSHGEEQAVAEAHEALQFLENELKVKGSKFFGGDNINLVDIAATFVAFWIGTAEEALGLELLPKDKFPKLTEWSDNYVNCQAVKDSLPLRENLVAIYKKRFGKA